MLMNFRPKMYPVAIWHSLIAASGNLSFPFPFFLFHRSRTDFFSATFILSSVVISAQTAKTFCRHGENKLDRFSKTKHFLTPCILFTGKS
jgi:hypothetical protein